MFQSLFKLSNKTTKTLFLDYQLIICAESLGLLLLILVFKVEALVGRIERIRHSPLHVSISEGVDQWHCSIRELQGRRREELSNGSNCSRSRMNSGLRYQDSAGTFEEVSSNSIILTCGNNG